MGMSLSIYVAIYLSGAVHARITKLRVLSQCHHHFRTSLTPLNGVFNNMYTNSLLVVISLQSSHLHFHVVCLTSSDLVRHITPPAKPWPPSKAHPILLYRGPLRPT